jgi:lipoprotein-releasing system permease protein
VGSQVNSISNWQPLEDLLKKQREITAVAPYVEGQVLLSSSGMVEPALIRGVDPQQEKTISQLASKMVAGALTDLTPGTFGVVLGEDLANRLQVMVGDKITVITPQVSLSPAGVLPRYKRFTVVGVFRSGSGFGFDTMLAFTSLGDAQKLMSMGNAVTGLHVNIKDVYSAPQVSELLAKNLSPTARITNWTDQYGAFFQAVSLEKTMMFLILMLIIAVAVFNLVCSLVMVVNEKEADIAILRTMGATPGTIMMIFIVQGATVGIVGTLLGVVGGILLALNVTDIVNGIQNLFHVQFLSARIYFVDYLPSQLQSADVWHISLWALSLSLIATIYPAWRATRTVPVEALRYE